MLRSAPSPAERAAILSAFWQPATDERLIMAFARLGVEASKFKSKTDAQTADLQLEAYIERLRAVPADIALWALYTWPERSSEWPHWNDLYRLIVPVLSARERLVERYKPNPLLAESKFQKDPDVAAGLKGLAGRLRADEDRRSALSPVGQAFRRVGLSVKEESK